MLGLCCCAGFLFHCGKQGPLSGRSARISHCGGLSRCRTQALGAWTSVAAACELSNGGVRPYSMQASVVLARGLSCSASMWEIPRLGIGPESPALASEF